MPGLAHSANVDYTLDMKKAVSIPEELVQRADRLAQSTGKSRSELVSEALQDYLARHDPDAVTESMNRVLDDIEPPHEGFVTTAARHVLEGIEC